MSLSVHPEQNGHFFQQFLPQLERASPITHYRLIEIEGVGYTLEKKPPFRIIRIIKEIFYSLVWPRNSSIDDHARNLGLLAHKTIARTDLNTPSPEQGHELLACCKTCVVMERLLIHVSNKKGMYWDYAPQRAEFRLLQETAMVYAAEQLGASPLWLSLHNGLEELTARFLTVPQYMEQVTDPQFATQALAIHQRCKLDLFVISELIRRGADCKKARLPLNHYLWKAVKHGDQSLALRLIEAGADVSYKSKKEQVPFITASRLGMRELVEAMLKKGVDATLRDGAGNGALHAACSGGQLDLVSFFRDKLDFAAKNNQGMTPFELFEAPQRKLFLRESLPLEKEFLLQDLHFRAQATYQQFVLHIQRLKEKYPKSSFDAFELSYLVIEKSHYKKGVQNITIPEPSRQIDLNSLLELFEKINFESPDAPNFQDPEALRVDTQITTTAHFRALLTEFIQKVEGEVVFTGTPSRGTESLKEFYRTIRDALKNCLIAVQEKSESDALVIAIIRAAPNCAGRYFSEAMKQYNTICKRKLPTFEEEVYLQLADLRSILSINCVPKDETHNVNAHNYFVQKLGEKYGIPGYQQFARYSDPFGASRIDLKEAEKQFCALYNAHAIVEWLEPLVKATLRDGFVDWYKANIPLEWRAEHFDAIRAHVATLKSEKEIIQFLESKEIMMRPGADPLKAIEEERQDAFLQAVVFDMQTGAIRRQAIADMILKMGIVSSLFDRPSFLEQVRQAAGSVYTKVSNWIKPKMNI